MKESTKCFELGAEGGLLTIYQMIDGKNNDWYSYDVNDLGMDDEVSGVQKKWDYSFSFVDDLIKLLYQYPHLSDLHPLYAVEGCVNVVLLLPQDYFKNNTTAHVDKQRWAEILNLSVEELNPTN